MAFNLASAAGGFVSEADKQRELEQRQQAIDLQTADQKMRQQEFDRQQAEIKNKQTADDIIAQEMSKVGQTTPDATAPGAPVNNYVMANQPGGTPATPAAPAAPSLALGPNGQPVPFNANPDANTGAGAGAAPTPPAVPGAPTTVPGKMILPSDALKSAAFQLQGLGLNRYALDPLKQAEAERYNEAFKMAAQTGDLQGALNHLNEFAPNLKATVSADPDDPTGQGLVVNFGNGAPAKKYKDRDDFLANLAASSSPENLIKYQLGADRITQAINQMDARARQQAAAIDARLQVGMGNIAERYAALDKARGGGAGKGGVSTLLPDGTPDYSLGFKNTGELAKYLDPNGTNPTGYVSTYNKLVSMNRGNRVDPTLLADATTQLMRDPSTLTVNADPATGNMYDYTYVGGNPVLVGPVSKVRYNAPSKPGEAAAPMNAQQSAAEITKQTADAASSWANSQPPAMQQAAATLLNPDGTLNQAKVTALASTPGADAGRTQAVINLARYLPQAKTAAPAGTPAPAAAAGNPPQAVTDYTRNQAAGIESGPLTSLGAAYQKAGGAISTGFSKLDAWSNRVEANRAADLLDGWNKGQTLPAWGAATLKRVLQDPVNGPALLQKMTPAQINAIQQY